MLPVAVVFAPSHPINGFPPSLYSVFCVLATFMLRRPGDVFDALRYAGEYMHSSQLGPGTSGLLTALSTDSSTLHSVVADAG